MFRLEIDKQIRACYDAIIYIIYIIYLYKVNLLEGESLDEWDSYFSCFMLMNEPQSLCRSAM